VVGVPHTGWFNELNMSILSWNFLDSLTGN